MEAIDYYPTDTEALPDGVDTPVERAGHDEPEEKDRDWGGELTALVSANAHIVVRCNWMGGAKVTVGEAMVNYSWPPDLTAADEPYLIAVVYDLLANRVDEEEEEQEKEEVDEETEEKPEDKVPEPKAKVAKKKEEESPDKVRKMVSETVKQKVREVRPEPYQPAPQPSLVTAGTHKITPTVRPPAIELHPAGQAAPKEISSRLAAATVEAVSTNPVPPETLIIEDLISAVHETLVETIENATLKSEEPEREELVFTQEFENEVFEVSADAATEELVAEATETEIIEAAPDSADYPVERIDIPEAEPIDAELVQVIGEEGGIGHTANLENPVSLEVIGYDPSTIEIEEAEATLVRLGATIETAAPETAEIVGAILEEIIETIEPGAETAIIADELRAELEELFVELFDELEVEYTPDVIEAVAKLMSRRQIMEEIQKLEAMKTAPAAPAGGTREIIKKLLTLLDKTKKSMVRAGAIGKSALRLCSFSLTPLPA